MGGRGGGGGQCGGVGTDEIGRPGCCMQLKDKKSLPSFCGGTIQSRSWFLAEKPTPYSWVSSGALPCQKKENSFSLTAPNPTSRVTCNMTMFIFGLLSSTSITAVITKGVNLLQVVSEARGHRTHIPSAQLEGSSFLPAVFLWCRCS